MIALCNCDASATLRGFALCKPIFFAKLKSATLNCNVATAFFAKCNAICVALQRYLRRIMTLCNARLRSVATIFFF